MSYSQSNKFMSYSMANTNYSKVSEFMNCSTNIANTTNIANMANMANMNHSKTRKISSPQRIKLLCDQELVRRTEYLVDQERQIVQTLIWHLQEIQDRKLYLAMNYTSMYECLIGHFKMSDTTAYGRIKVLKIIEEIPQVSDSLKNGELNISSIALAHSFIEKHQKSTGEFLSQSEKIELMENLKNKTTAEVKEVLARCNPESSLPYDEVRPLTAEHSQLRSTVSKQFIEKMEYLKSLISHENINPTHEELLSQAFDALIEKVEKKKGIFQSKPMELTKLMALKKLTDSEKPIEPKKSKESRKPKAPKVLMKLTESEESKESKEIKELKESKKRMLLKKSTDSTAPKEQEFRSTSEQVNSPTSSVRRLTDGNHKCHSRYISRNIKRFIFNRAQGRCEHIHENGKRCASNFQTQFDHIIAFSKGGPSTLENLQLLCRVHNSYKGDE